MEVGRTDIKFTMVGDEEIGSAQVVELLAALAKPASYIMHGKDIHEYVHGAIMARSLPCCVWISS